MTSDAASGASRDAPDHLQDDWRRGLVELAWALGVEPYYYDVVGQQHHASVETLLQVMTAWGAPIEQLADVPHAWEWWHEQVSRTALEPVLVWWSGDPLSFRLRLPSEVPVPEAVRATLTCEDGTTLQLGTISLDDGPRDAPNVWHGAIATREWWVSLAAERPDGYHRLILEVGTGRFESSVLAAPRSVRGFGPGERRWGAFAPVYSLRRRADVGELDRHAQWLASLGASVVATLPILATFLDEPLAPSPYTPVSRRFWNELFLDLERLVEGAGDGHEVLVPELGKRLDALDAPGTFDYRRRTALVHDVVGRLSRARDMPPPRMGNSTGVADLDRYASFRAVADQERAGWRSWPARLRDGDVRPGDVDPDRAALHRFAQEAMHGQLASLAAAMQARGQRLYLDLPIGAHPDGYDTWHERSLFAASVATGAPPDDFFTEGQNWGFPPPLPLAGRLQAHEHFRACLRHHMEVAGVLRLDHVMGLHRLYWVPDGMDATEGTYVRYPRDELFAVLAIESQRNDCVVIGEDLGTVPDEVRVAMAEHEASGMYVAQFSVPTHAGGSLAEPSPRSMAGINTHDTPTFAGFLHGLDITHRVESDLLDVHDAHHEFEAREWQVDNLRRSLTERRWLQPPSDDHALLVALLRFLGASDAECVLVALEDLWGEVHPQNIPGTPVDRPNWVQRFPFDLDELADQPQVKAALLALDEERTARR